MVVIDFSCPMSNMYLEVSKSMFSYLMQHLATSSVIWLKIKKKFFLYDTLFLSQLFQLIISFSLKDHLFQTLAIISIFVWPYIYSFL